MAHTSTSKRTSSDAQTAHAREKQAPLKWTETQLQAVELVFEGRWTLAEIAERCAVSPRTIDNWVARPDFRARLQEMRDDFAERVKGIAYTDKQQRIMALAQLAESARRTYEEKPILIEERPTRNGPATTETYNRDALEAVRGCFDDIAKELGHRKAEKSENDAAPVRIIIETDSADTPRVQVTTEAE